MKKFIVGIAMAVVVAASALAMVGCTSTCKEPGCNEKPVEGGNGYCAAHAVGNAILDGLQEGLDELGDLMN